MKLHVVEIEKGHPGLRKDTPGDFTKEEMDTIAHHFNSHEKYKIACARAYEGLCTNDPDACDEAIKLLDEITEEAGEPK